MFGLEKKFEAEAIRRGYTVLRNLDERFIVSYSRHRLFLDGPMPSHGLEFGQDFIRKYQKIKVTTVGTLSNGVLQIAIALGQEHLDMFGKKAAGELRFVYQFPLL